MILDRLKEETKEEHQSLEKYLIPFIKSIATPAQYGRLLAMFYGCYMPLEKSIYRFLNEGDIYDIQERRKSASIMDDLDATGIKKPIPASPYMPVIDNKYRALGALYVLEGSTLGGKIIAQIISKNNPGIQAGAFSFFNAYGDNSFQKWGIFQNILNNMQLTGAAADDIVAGAADTFSAMRQWASASLDNTQSDVNQSFIQN